MNFLNSSPTRRKLGDRPREQSVSCKHGGCPPEATRVALNVVWSLEPQGRLEADPGGLAMVLKTDSSAWLAVSSSLGTLWVAVNRIRKSLQMVFTFLALHMEEESEFLIRNSNDESGQKGLRCLEVAGLNVSTLRAG